jgi:hypothetical protein
VNRRRATILAHHRLSQRPTLGQDEYVPPVRHVKAWAFDCGVKRRNLDQPPAFVGPGFDIEASPDKLSLEGEAKRVSCQKTRNFTDMV